VQSEKGLQTLYETNEQQKSTVETNRHSDSVSYTNILFGFVRRLVA